MRVISTYSTFKLASSMCNGTTSQLHRIERKRFPDGEMYVRIEGELYGKDVLVMGNTNADDGLLELMFLLDAVKEQQPAHITLLVPYFGYARQHMIYKPGESITGRVVMEQISSNVDHVVTVNIHDTASFKFSHAPCEDFHAFRDIAAKFRDKDINLVMAPDDGAYKLAKEVADVLQCNSNFMNKKRINSTTVKYDMEHVDVKGLNVLLVDDIISTGGTILRSTEIIRSSGASKIYISAIHGLFINGADRKIKEQCDGLSVTNTIESQYSDIDISVSLSKYLQM
jgi:ribose-phosphate pyrophosphokinase